MWHPRVCSSIAILLVAITIPVSIACFDFNEYIRQISQRNTLGFTVREVVIAENSRFLARLLNTDNVNNFNTAFSRRLIYTGGLKRAESLKIYENAIDQVYGLKKPSVLATYLYRIDADHYESITLTIEAELYLFWKFIERGDIDDGYLLFFGYYIQQFKLRNQASLPAAMHRRLDKAIAQLPTTLKNLFFTKNMCLLNAGYSEYIYEPLGILVDKDRSNVFTWAVPRSVGSNGVWNMEFTETYIDGNVAISVRMHNWLKKHYLYRDTPLGNRITMWVPGTVPENSLWLLTLNEEKIVLSQDKFMMCAVESLHDDKRRFVQALIRSSPLMAACEWSIDHCPTVTY